MNKEATAEIERKIKELDELTRVVTNGLNWIGDLDVKVAYIQPVNEFVSFLQGFKANIAAQKSALESTLPKMVEEPSKTTVLADAK